MLLSFFYFLFVDSRNRRTWDGSCGRLQLCILTRDNKNTRWGKINKEQTNLLSFMITVGKKNKIRRKISKRRNPHHACMILPCWVNDTVNYRCSRNCHRPIANADTRSSNQSVRPPFAIKKHLDSPAALAPCHLQTKPPPSSRTRAVRGKKLIEP